MKKNLNYVFILLLSLLLFVGCGSSNSESNSGVLIDDIVSGVKYVNGNNSGITDREGKFPYESGSVEFYLGGIKIGEIDSLNADKMVFVQDLVGVERTNIDNEKVLKVASLLQSLDSDTSTDAIEINTDDFEKFNSENTDIDDVDIDSLLLTKGFRKVSEDDVKRHLSNIIKKYNLNENTNTVETEITVKNIQTNINTDNSNIMITFSDDISKDNLQEVFKLSDSKNNNVDFDLTYNFDSITLILKDEINSFDNYSITIEVSKLMGYGIKGEETNINLTFGSDEQSAYAIDIIPPTLKLNMDYSENISSNLSRLTLEGTVSDEDLKEVRLELNNKTIETTIVNGKFTVDFALSAGLNIFKVIAVDENGNKTSITSKGGITLSQTVSAGGSHSGALKNGVLYTWGRNNYGQTGLGYTSSLKDETNGTHPISPIKITTPSKFVSIAFNQNFSLAIDKNGDVYSWGHDKYGELGRGDEYDEICDDVNCRKDIGKIENLSNISYLSAGYSHSLAIKTDNTIWAFGTGTNGELGNLKEESSSTPVQVDFGDENPIIVQVSAGSDFSLALDIEGQVWAWGKNNNGQMGQGEEYGTSNQLTPVKVPFSDNTEIVSISTGKAHVVALAKDGSVYGWGLNSSSQIGYYGYQYKDTDDAWDRYIHTPKKILDNDDTNPVIQVYAGGNSSYILKEDKKIYPWGQYGETLSDGSQEYNNLDYPEDKLTSITSVKNISAGLLHVVAQKEDDTVFTWRWSYEGSLGGGESTANIWFYLYPILPEFPEE